MANSVELWMEEYGVASKSADEISKMLSDHGHGSLLPSDPASKRHLLRMRTRIAILSSRLWNLEENHARIPKKIIWDKNMHKRKEMLSNLREKEKQIASVIDMWHTVETPEDLPGSSNGGVEEENCFGAGLDNRWIDYAQREIMKQQDEVLARFEKTVLVRNKHFALALNKKLNMQTRLMDSLDQIGEPTDSGSRRQSFQNRLEKLRERNIQERIRACLCLLLSVLVIVLLAVIAWKLRMHLPVSTLSKYILH